MQYECNCKHYWGRKGTCENTELTKEMRRSCPYYGSSEITLLGYDQVIKCSGFTPQSVYCTECETLYEDGTIHTCTTS